MRLLGVGGQERRSTKRQAAAWHGNYDLPARPTMESGDCRVLDVSKTGAGLELHGPWPRWAVDEEIVVRLEIEDSEFPYELRGRVRHSTRTKSGSVRAGVEFVGLSPSEQTMLRTLSHRRAKV